MAYDLMVRNGRIKHTGAYPGRVARSGSTAPAGL